MASGKRLGKNHAERVQAWIAERDAMGDYREYERGGKVHRTILCAELDFARSVTTQNPAVRASLLEAERRWYGTPHGSTDAHDAARDRAEHKSVRLQRALNRALDENARLKSEISLLREKLKKYGVLDEILAETGRIPRV